jgi:DNA-binding winged helix-turn-helix (wHTH) protein
MDTTKSVDRRKISAQQRNTFSVHLSPWRKPDDRDDPAAATDDRRRHDRADQSGSASTVRTGKLTVRLDKGIVEVEGRPVHLTRSEFRTLELLGLHKGTTVAKAMFFEHLYGSRGARDPKIIDVYICKLRKKIAQATSGDHYIVTVWGHGYALTDHPVAATPARRERSREARDVP